MIKVSASVACANFAHLENDVRELEEGGVDILHFDVVDGLFAPTFALSPVILRSLRKMTNIPFDVHLAVNYPGRYIKEFVEAGSDIITVHIEAQDDLRQVIREIKAFDNKTAVALKPATSLSALEEDILDEIDMVLLMTVNPGFAGQDFNYSVISKIQELKKIIERRGLRT
ncbi:MAG: ribulose-phosphate 3-epimerase, partial [Candidatus Aerophobetes bacterium]|nr:ribulose-phosphate 3-epimerase [Candidatus Aerophobetes bacterium]